MEPTIHPKLKQKAIEAASLPETQTRIPGVRPDLSNSNPTAAREVWLRKAARELGVLFEDAGYKVPENTRVAVGYAPTHAKSTLGVCYYPVCSTDGVHEIWISPVLDDPARVLDVLLHELIHTVAGPGAGHGKGFSEIAAKLGLKRPWTATTATDELRAVLNQIAHRLGYYPHARHSPRDLDAPLPIPGGPGIIIPLPAPRPADIPKKQASRMLKATCPECGYTIRVARSWIALSLPICRNGHDDTEFVVKA